MSQNFFASRTAHLGVTASHATAPPSPTDAELSEKLQKTVDNWTATPADIIEKRRHAVSRVKTLFSEFVKKTCQRKTVSESPAKGVESRIEIFGSILLGVDDRDSDVDVLCVGPKFVTRDDFFHHFVQVLNADAEISVVLAVQDANVPVINLVFNGIQMHIVYARLLVSEVTKDLNLLDDSLLEHLDQLCIRSLNGLRVSKQILALVPNIASFKIVLRFIKTWAKQRAVYSNILGFLGGVAWAVLVAKVCQLYPNAAASVIANKFFNVILNWDWSKPVTLREILETEPFKNVKHTILMPIIMPAVPVMYASHNVTRSAFQLLLSELKRGVAMSEKIALSSAAWADLLEPSEFFTKFQYYIQIIASSNDSSLQFKWSHLVESHIRILVLNMESVSESMQLAQAFVKPFQKSVPCKTQKEAESACLGVVPATVYNEPTTTIFTSTFYVGLQVDSVSGGLLNLSEPIEAFVERVKSWEGFQSERMGIFVRKLRTSQIPADHDLKLLQNGSRSSTTAKSTGEPPLTKNLTPDKLLQLEEELLIPSRPKESTSIENGDLVQESSTLQSNGPAPPNPNGIIFIGGLDLTVTEFRLKKTFEKYGQIAKLDYHFHKVGPKMGHPKGSAFIKFTTEAASLKCISALHGAVPPWNGGRKLIVAWSKTVGIEKPLPNPSDGSYAKPLKRPRTKQEYEQRALEASINKKVQLQPASAESRIAAIERKLLELDAPAVVSSDSSSDTRISSLRHPLPLRPNPVSKHEGNYRTGVGATTPLLLESVHPPFPTVNSFNSFIIDFAE